MPPNEVDECGKGQNGQQNKSGRERLSGLRFQMKWAQVQAGDRKKRQREKQQQCGMKITLRPVGSGHHEAPLPNGGPCQRNGKHDGKSFSQRTSRHQKIEMWLLQEKGNPMVGQMKTARIRKE